MIDQHRINAKPSILMTASGHINGSEIIHSWSQTSHYSIVDHDHGSTTSTALLVVIIFFGFALVGIFLLWRRHRYLQRFANIKSKCCEILFPSAIYSHAICHYTTLNQELTLNSSDGPDSVDIQDFNLDVSGSSSSSDDEVYSSESDW